MSGLLLLSAMALIVGPIPKSHDPRLSTTLMAVIVVMATACAIAYAAARRSMVRALRTRGPDPQQAVEPYQVYVIQGGGLIEGPAFFAVVAYLVTGQVWALGGVALAVVLLALHFPSVAKLRRLAEKLNQY